MSERKGKAADGQVLLALAILTGAVVVAWVAASVVATGVMAHNLCSPSVAVSYTVAGHAKRCTTPTCKIDRVRTIHCADDSVVTRLEALSDTP